MYFFMKNIFINTKTDKFNDRFMQSETFELPIYDSFRLTQIEKKENKICPRFSFLKISIISVWSTFACCCLRWLGFAHHMQKSCNYFNGVNYKKYFL